MKSIGAGKTSSASNFRNPSLATMTSATTPSSTKPSGRWPAPRPAPAAAEERIITLPELSARLQEYLNPEAVAAVERAFHYAKAAHEGQMRKTGHTYITHPT